MTDQHREKLKGEKALAIAKNIPRTQIYVPRGITGEILSQHNGFTRGINGGKKIDHSEVIKMLNDGHTQSEVARKFRITSQAVSYIKKKNKA